MTSRERIIRAIKKEEVDRLPFFPKLFNDAYFTAHGLDEKNMSPVEVAEYLDCAIIFEGLPCPFRLKWKNAEEKVLTEKNRITTIYRTPESELTQVREYAPDSFSWHPTEYPVKTKKDLKAVRSLFADFFFELDEQMMREVKGKLASLGEQGIGLMWDWRTPVMALLQDWIGIENTIYFLSDCREEMEELMELMHVVHKERTKLLVGCKEFEFLTPVENTSTTLISPDIFRRYCVPQLTEYAEIVKNVGKFYVLHMCGSLKDILPDVEKIPADTIEAFTTPPLGNATLADAAELCPKKSIIGGTNANLWLKNTDEIISEIKRVINNRGTIDGLIISSGGQMPVACGLEKVKKISTALKDIKWQNSAS